jgi:hypothetical protein
MRSGLVVIASDYQCTKCNGPGFDPSIRRHSGISGAVDEAVLNIVRKKSTKKRRRKKKMLCLARSLPLFISVSYFLCQSRVTVLNQGAVLIRRRGRPVASSDEEDEEEEVERKNTETEADKEPPPPARDPLEVR